ncbi:MAG: hypothetical protein IKZ48_07840 [Prevotella sp.]|nr:hypothetical protein [Prevotella sp.]
MKATPYVLFLLLSACCLPIAAQRRLVAIDVDASVPVVGASVMTNGGTFTTDSVGRFAVPDTCRLIFVTHMNYENRIVNLSEVRDTVFLISKELNLREVVVFGTGPTDEKIRKLNESLRIPPKDAQMLKANPNQGMNVLGLLKAVIPKKWFRNSKEEQRKRLEKTLEEY